MEITPEIQAVIDEQTKGLRVKADELLAEAKKAKAELKTYDGIDPVKTRQMLENVRKSQVASLIAEGKHEEALAIQTESTKKQYEEQLAALSGENAQLKTAAAESLGKLQRTMVSQSVQAAAAKAGMVPAAIEDACLRGQSIFAVGEDGVIGAVIDGKKITPEAWAESMKIKAPHWFPASTGAGALGGAGGKFTGDDTSKMTPQQKMDYARRKP